MKKILILIILLFAVPSFAATWTIEVRKDGVKQSSRDISSDEIKDIQIASERTGKDVYNYFWEAIGDMFRGIEDENIAAQQKIDLDETKAKMRQ